MKKVYDIWVLTPRLWYIESSQKEEFLKSITNLPFAPQQMCKSLGRACKCYIRLGYRSPPPLVWTPQHHCPSSSWWRGRRYIKNSIFGWSVQSVLELTILIFWVQIKLSSLSRVLSSLARYKLIWKFLAAKTQLNKPVCLCVDKLKF